MQRGTEDIDAFLSTEIITDAAKTSIVRGALDRLGYSPAVKFKHFEREIAVAESSRRVKIDLLAGPVPDTHHALIELKDGRIKPAGSTGLHAHPTPEAFSLERGLQEIDISGRGEPLEIFIPHPFTYLVLKLFALRDRLEKSNDVKQRYHALDLFSIWGMLTEVEAEELRAWTLEYEDEPRMNDARTIALDLFGDQRARGMTSLIQQAESQRLRLVRKEIDDFRRDLLWLLRLNSGRGA